MPRAPFAAFECGSFESKNKVILSQAKELFSSLASCLAHHRRRESAQPKDTEVPRCVLTEG